MTSSTTHILAKKIACPECRQFSNITNGVELLGLKKNITLRNLIDKLRIGKGKDY